MAIAAVGACTVIGAIGVSASATVTVATNAIIEAGNVAILIWAGNNSSASDGDNNEHLTVTDSAGAVSWTKLGEYTNSGGAADAGVTSSIWYRPRQGSDLASGQNITCTRTDARSDQVAFAWEFSCATELRLDAGPATGEVNGANDFSSETLSSLPNVERLYARVLGKEANVTNTQDLTVSTNFTSFGNGRSRNNASSICLRGEFRINTSTGETSAPTFAFSGDTAEVMVGLVETIVVSTGLGALTLTGFAPTVTTSNHQTAAPGVGTLTASGFAPTVSVGALVSTAPGVLDLTGFAPTVETPITVATAGGQLTLTGFAPTVTAPATATPGLGALVLDGFAPTVLSGTTATPDTGALVLTGFAPAVSTTAHVTAAPAAGALSLTGFAPAVSAPTTVTTGVGALTLVGLAPTATATAHVTVTPGAGLLALAGYAPAVLIAGLGPVTAAPDTGLLVLTGYAPTASQRTNSRLGYGSPTPPATTGPANRHDYSP